MVLGPDRQLPEFRDVPVDRRRPVLLRQAAWVKDALLRSEAGSPLPRLRDRMWRDGIAERVAKREVSAERPVLRGEDDRRAPFHKMVVQGVGVVAAEPHSTAPAARWRT